MFATLTDIYLRFGKENVLATVNLDADDPYEPEGVERIRRRNPEYRPSQSNYLRLAGV